MKLSAIIQYVSILLIMLLMPFKVKALAPLFVVFSIATVFTRGYFSSMRSILRSSTSLLMLSLYVLHVIALLWSDNIEFGMFDLQVKLTLLVVPLFLAPAMLNGSIGRSALIRIYSIGVLGALLICIVRASIRSDIPGAFYYQEFSWFMHPGYFAMHLCLAFGIFTEKFLYRRTDDPSFRLNLFFAALMCSGVILLSSKTGIIVLAVLFVTQLVRWLARNPGSRVATFITLLILTTVITVMLRDSVVMDRFSQLTDVFDDPGPTSEYNSTTVRMEAWHASWDLIREAPLTGYGTGDIKDVLVSYYAEHSLPALEEGRINPHNQFLQTWIALGLVGVLLLGSIIFSLLRTAMKRKDVLAMFLGIILLINMFVESVIEVEAGVMFFSMFVILLSSQRVETGNP